MRPGPTDEIINRVESIEGRAASEALRALYVDQKFRINDLCARWSCNPRTVMRMMKHFGIKSRRGSEAVKLQWEGADWRRAISAEVMRKIALNQSAEGKHNRLGKTKETDEGVKRAAEKLKHSTSARRPEVRAKIIASCKATHIRDPSTHPNYHAKPTKSEQGMLDALSGWGFEATHNHCVAPYWIDVFVPELSLGIECFSKSRCRTMLWGRHQDITAQGIRLIYVSNWNIKRSDLGDLHQYITRLQVLGFDPATHGQETVIWGCQDFNLFRDHPDNISVKRTTLGRSYRLDVSTAADHQIATLDSFD